MVFFSYIELVRYGEIFQSVTANTAQSQVGFIDGELKVCGNQRMWENLMQQADAVGEIDWEIHFDG